MSHADRAYSAPQELDDLRQEFKPGQPDMCVVGNTLFVAKPVPVGHGCVGCVGLAKALGGMELCADLPTVLPGRVGEVMNLEQAAACTQLRLSTESGVIRFEQIGSSTVPGATPYDVDFLVLIHGCCYLQRNAHRLFRDFEPDLTMHYAGMGTEFCSLRKGDVNLIVTDDPVWYARQATANRVCIALRLVDKADRLKVFAIVRDDASVEDAEDYARGA